MERLLIKQLNNRTEWFLSLNICDKNIYSNKTDGFGHLQQHLAHQVDPGLQENQQGPSNKAQG